MGYNYLAMIKIKINNFRSIKSQNVTMTKNVLAVIGPNESGKSNFLNALSKINRAENIEENDILVIDNKKIKNNPELTLRWSFDSPIIQSLISDFIYKYSSNNETLKNVLHFFKNTNLISELTFEIERDFNNSFSFLNKSIGIDKALLRKLNETFIEDFNPILRKIGIYLMEDTLFSGYKLNFFWPPLIRAKDEGKKAFCEIYEAINLFKTLWAFTFDEPVVKKITNFNLIDKRTFNLSLLTSTSFDGDGDKYKDKMQLEDWLKLMNIDKEQIVKLLNSNENNIDEISEIIANFNKRSEEIFKKIKNYYSFRGVYFSAEIVNNILNIKLIDDDKKSGKIDNKQLSTRSDGFQAFYMMCLQILSFNKDKPAIILLDEPERSLNPVLQKALLEFIINRSSNNIKIIYTTHSPFMIDLNSNADNILVYRNKNTNETMLSLSGGEGIKKSDIDSISENSLDILMRDEFVEFLNLIEVAAINKDKVLLVEGKIDKEFFATLLNKNNISNVLVLGVGGENFLRTNQWIFEKIKNKKIVAIFDKDDKGKKFKSKAFEVFGDEAKISTYGDILGKDGDYRLESVLNVKDDLKASFEVIYKYFENPDEKVNKALIDYVCD